MHDGFVVIRCVLVSYVVIVVLVEVVFKPCRKLQVHKIIEFSQVFNCSVTPNDGSLNRNGKRSMIIHDIPGVT